MPTVLRIDGHRFFFFSNEGDEPPHIHIEKAENHAKFWLTPVAPAKSVGYHAAELTRLENLAEEHRLFFEGKWHEYFGG